MLTAGSTSVLLSARNLHLWRGERHVLRGVSCEIGAGHALHVSGPNGCGKTTLLRVVCGLLEAEEGEVLWQGLPIRDSNSAYHAAIAYLAHDTALKGDLTPVENLRYSVGLRRSLSDAEIHAVLANLGVSDCARLPARVLSAGQRRRVALCRVLLSRARFWVLDEPFTNLDASSSEQISGALASHLNDGGLALVAAHQGLELRSGRISKLAL
ncbi:MAG TPA: cytochrome c biogenesis heme-transporting ATPase CcmA [Steroidobacteraceae bacterium]|nr:cytochrome c biogenesis heme-transporting ATPase CcmA [Steroidobacteraceae bacterium]